MNRPHREELTATAVTQQRFDFSPLIQFNSLPSSGEFSSNICVSRCVIAAAVFNQLGLKSIGSQKSPSSPFVKADVWTSSSEFQLSLRSSGVCAWRNIGYNRDTRGLAALHLPFQTLTLGWKHNMCWETPTFNLFLVGLGEPARVVFNAFSFKLRS